MPPLGLNTKYMSKLHSLVLLAACVLTGPLNATDAPTVVEIPVRLVRLMGSDVPLLKRSEEELLALKDYNSEQRKIQNYEVEIYLGPSQDKIEVRLLASVDSPFLRNHSGNYEHARSITFFFAPKTLKLLGARHPK
jgi:hypothetical protein